MKKYFVLTITLISLVAFVFPQQGEYTRKSVSSLESVWIKDGALQGVSNFDYTTFDKFIDFYVEVERFDYNVLPGEMISDLTLTYNQARQAYITKELIEIVNGAEALKG